MTVGTEHRLAGRDAIPAGGLRFLCACGWSTDAWHEDEARKAIGDHIDEQLDATGWTFVPDAPPELPHTPPDWEPFTPEEWFVCDACGKRFDSENGLRGHRGRMHGTAVIPMTCGECGGTFVGNRGLTRHVNQSGHDPNAPRHLNAVPALPASPDVPAVASSRHDREQPIGDYSIPLESGGRLDLALYGNLLAMSEADRRFALTILDAAKRYPFTDLTPAQEPPKDFTPREIGRFVARALTGPDAEGVTIKLRASPDGYDRIVLIEPDGSERVITLIEGEPTTVGAYHWDCDELAVEGGPPRGEVWGDDRYDGTCPACNVSEGVRPAFIIGPTDPREHTR